MRKLFLQTERDGWGKKLLNAALVAAVLVGFVVATMVRLGAHWDFSHLAQYRLRLAQGFGMTLVYSGLSLVVSLIIGFVTATGSRSAVLPVKYLCRTYVQIIRGTPLLVQIYLFYYLIGTAWGLDNRTVAGVLILSLFEGAYVSEIIRGGLDSIEASQMEIARAIGLTGRQTTRLVVLPQLLRRILPALAGQFASIIKDSSLLSVIAIIELTQATKEVASASFAFFVDYLLLGLLYFALTLPISMLTRRLERRFRYEN